MSFLDHDFAVWLYEQNKYCYSALLLTLIIASISSQIVNYSVWEHMASLAKLCGSSTVFNSQLNNKTMPFLDHDFALCLYKQNKYCYSAILLTLIIVSISLQIMGCPVWAFTGSLDDLYNWSNVLNSQLKNIAVSFLD
jgi:hypothetical protein